MTDSSDTMRWARRGVVVAILVIGWLFIAWQNHFRITAPTAFVCLGYLAVILAIYNLWRTGAATVDSSEEEDSTWAKPAGALGELEREKRTLLKAIKEAEFDRDMGKLSQRDADDMIRGYRARAIEVIKEIDLLGHSGAGTVREQILREVRARVQLDGKATKKVGAEARPSKAKTDARPGAGPDAKSDAKPNATSAAPAGAGDLAAGALHGVEAPLGAASATPDPAASADRPAQAATPQRPRDEELDADSTTALEPRDDESAKEATP